MAAARTKPNSHQQKAKFTSEEDNKLKLLVSLHGEECWQTIANNLPGRSARQCRDRWRNYLCPKIVNGPWSEEEDSLLRDKFNDIGPHWKEIARSFPSRTDVNVKSRWNLLQRRIAKEKMGRERALDRKSVKTPSGFTVYLRDGAPLPKFLEEEEKQKKEAEKAKDKCHDLIKLFFGDEKFYVDEFNTWDLNNTFGSINLFE